LFNLDVLYGENIWVGIKLQQDPLSPLGRGSLLRAPLWMTKAKRLNPDHNELGWFEWRKADIDVERAMLVIDIRRRSEIAWDVKRLVSFLPLELTLST
jgi:hypothetical protein